jgi:two-component sensor histidine kinase
VAAEPENHRIVLWGPSLVQIYNAAYAEICGARHPVALGQPTRECWPEVWEFNEPVYTAVQRGEVRAFERQLLTIRRDGEMTDAWFDLTYSPVRDEGEAVAGVLVTVSETTHQIRLAQMTEAAAKEVERLRLLFERAPGFNAILRGPDHVFDFANEAYMRLAGHRPVLGRPLREAFPEIAGQRFLELLDEVYASGTPHVGTGVPLRLYPSGVTPSGDIYVDFLYSPSLGLDGEVTGVYVQGVDATDRILAEERQTLFNNELNHRVKNTLATVLSMAMLARKSAKSVEDFTQSFTDRVAAMALTHDLLTHKGWAPVRVRDLLALELTPYMGAAGQVDLHSDDLLVAPDAAVNLSLIVHELLTNAAKYGALATPNGRLVVNCQRQDAGAVLIWREQLQRPMPAPGVAGFGTRLIKRLSVGLGWRTDIEPTPTGMHATITFALSALTSGAAVREAAHSEI